MNSLLILSPPQDSNSDIVEKISKSDSPVHTSTSWGEDSSESGIRNALGDYSQSSGIIITFTNTFELLFH